MQYHVNKSQVNKRSFFDVSLVLPCFNEEEGLKKILPQLKKLGLGELILVDNNSTDNSIDIARGYVDKIIRAKKQGVGEALKVGFKEASRLYVAVMDADGQHNPRDLARMIRLIKKERLDFVDGSRFLNKGKGFSGGLVRTFGNKIQTRLFNMLFGSRISDSQCGMFVARKEVLNNFELASSGFSIIEEIKARVITGGYAYKELPILWDQRLVGDPSKLSVWKDGAKNIWFLIKFWAGLFRRRRPRFSEALPYLFIFSFSLLFFGLIQFSGPGIIDTDPFYHLKMTLLLKERGLEVLSSFHWMHGTILERWPTDLYLLYHLSLVPFVSIFGPLAGLKASSVVFSSLLIVAFYWTLRSLRAAFPFVVALLLILVMEDYFVRLLIPRPFVLSSTLFLVGLTALLKNRPYLLGLTALIYAYAYPGFFFLFAAIAGYLVVHWYARRALPGWRLLVLPVLGALVGLVLRPDFPNNIIVNYYQVAGPLINKILGLGFLAGNEIVTPLFTNGKELAITPFLLIFFTASMIYFLLYLKKSSTLSVPIITGVVFISLSVSSVVLAAGILNRLSLVWMAGFLTFFFFIPWLTLALMISPQRIRSLPQGVTVSTVMLIATGFFVLTLPASRFIEYSVPLSLLLFGLLAVPFLETFKSYSIRVKYIFVGAVVFLLAGAMFFQLKTGFRYINSAGLPDDYKEAALWLKENIAPGEVVFNFRWDFFPYMFFYNDRNYYVMGFDPLFLYFADQERFWLWQRWTFVPVVCLKQNCPQELFSRTDVDKKIARLIKEEFDARYLVIPRVPFHHYFLKMLDGSDMFEEVFSAPSGQEDPSVSVFRVR